MTSSGHVNMSASVWRRKCRNMWNMYQISPNVPSNGSEASHRWHCPQSTSHRQPRPAKHIFHSVQMDKLTNGPSWSTLLVIAARLSMVCSTYMYILYFLDLFSFFLTLQLRHCMHDDKRCSGILSGSYWQHCDFLHGAILTEDLLAATQLVQNSLHLYGFSPCTSIWSSSCCFGMFWHVLSWYVMVTCRDTICNSCAQIPVMLWGRALVKAWSMSIGRPVTKRVSLGGGDPFAMAVLQIADPTEFAQLAAQRRLWHCDLVHSSVQWCLLSQSCCLRLCHSMWHWAS